MDGGSWRRRILRGLERAPRHLDAKEGLLANVIGEPSAELLARLAEPGRDAAVLIGLIERRPGPTVLLTERARHLRDHAGQVSLPGGRLAGPDEDPTAAALREASEEVGLGAPDVRVLGSLTPQITGTGFNVTPVVGWIGAGFAPRPDPAEVQSVFEVPLRYLLDPANHVTGTRERWGTTFLVHEYHYAGYRIWGATAAILARFVEAINE